MSNWLISRDAVKRAGRQGGLTAIPDDRNRVIDALIEATSREIEQRMHTSYLPITQTRLYRWPSFNRMPGWVLYLDGHLISLTALQVQAQNSSPTTIGAADYFLEPQQYGPPYLWIEIDLSSTSAFQAGDTPQRSVSVAGVWGYPPYPGTSMSSAQDAGTVASGLASSASATTMVCSDASLIDVGDTLLIESEQLFVSERRIGSAQTTVGGSGLTASVTDTTLTVASGAALNVGEVILVDSERMFIREIAGNVATVQRAYDGTALAAHTAATSVYAYRSLTVQRGMNGTTATTHANSTAVSRYLIYGPAADLALADVLAKLAQTDAAWGRAIGQGEGAQEYSGRALKAKWDRLMSTARLRTAAI